MTRLRLQPVELCEFCAVQRHKRRAHWAISLLVHAAYWLTIKRYIVFRQPVSVTACQAAVTQSRLQRFLKSHQG
jgi:hypothetical protein